MNPKTTVVHGDWIQELQKLPAESVHCMVTSPPYWGLRKYLKDGDPLQAFELGSEPTIEEYLAKMVAGFREAWRVLRKDGTLWLNLGDCYASNGGHTDTACNDRRGQYNLGNRPEHDKRDFRVRGSSGPPSPRPSPPGEGEHLGAQDKFPTTGPLKGGCSSWSDRDATTGAPAYGALKPKDLVGVPWRVAFALQADGWWLRQEIIWAKPNPMPESVTDRCTKSHEQIFLLAKSGTNQYWVHRSGRGTRKPPPPDYRWMNFDSGEEAAVEPADWKMQVAADGRSRLWARKNLWTGSDYFYDAEAIKERSSPETHPRRALKGAPDNWPGSPLHDGRNAEMHPNVGKHRTPGNKVPAKGQAACEAGDERQQTKAGLLAYAKREELKHADPEVCAPGQSGRKEGSRANGEKCHPQFNEAMSQHLVSSRNKRDVWTVSEEEWQQFLAWKEMHATDKKDVWTVGSFAYKGAHFATFPPDLITPCILAGTSAGGCCANCGAPRERRVENGAPNIEQQLACGSDANGEYNGQNTKDYQRHKAQPASTVKERILAGMVEKKTVGWAATCECEEQSQAQEPTPHPQPLSPGEAERVAPKLGGSIKPCVVLDPFGGSGTTAEVANKFGRSAIVIELNREYLPLIHRRTDQTPGLMGI